MFPFISQCPLYYSDSEKEKKKPTAELDFLFVEMHLIAGREFNKVQFCNKTQFPFHIRATLWQRNCNRCLSQREHNCEACWHPARSVSPALAAGWGAAVRGKALAQLGLDVSTAKEAATKCAGLCSGFPWLSLGTVPCSSDGGAADGLTLRQRAAAASAGGFGLAVNQSLAQVARAGGGIPILQVFRRYIHVTLRDMV